MLKNIDKFLMDNKNCVIVHANSNERSEFTPDYLALEFLSKDEIMESLLQGEDYIFPNIVAVNVLNDFDELRLDLNRILKNSKWANESCIVILDVEEENIELLKRFSVHHNVSMILVTKNKEIVLTQFELLDINMDEVIKMCSLNNEYSKALFKLAESVKTMNDSYREIKDTLDIMADF